MGVCEEKNATGSEGEACTGKACTGATPAGEETGEGHPVVVHLNLPFAVEARGRSERERVVGWDGDRAHAYLVALQREIAANAAEFSDCTVRAVRLGGGIATNARADDLLATCRVLREALRIGPEVPMSARASICNISGASMPLLKRAGIGRFDFELLALDRADFVRLNHSDPIQNLPYIVDSFLHAYTNKMLGYVLSYGFDASGTAAFRRSIVEVTRSPASHLVLERWAGARAGMRSDVPAASEELAAAQLGEAREVLGVAGFREYAPLRFAKSGDEDAFWVAEQEGCDVLGFGLGAVTRFDGAETTNTEDWDTYLQFSDDFARITASARQL